MKKSIVLLLIMFSTFGATANNIQISNVTTSQVGSSIVINFNLTWENSWRTASTGNYDGAWVFFKFKDTDGTWKPIRFTGNDITAPAGYTVDISSNGPATGIGAFIYRSGLGFGNVSLTNVKAGISASPGVFDLRGFAVEMVYIPQGSFYVGDSTGIINQTYQSGSTIAAYQVIGNGSTVVLGTGVGKFNGEGEQSASGDLTGFPVGYAAYWMMKYELSQGAWCEFMNTLTYDQQKTRFPTFATPASPIGTLITKDIRGRVEIITPGVVGSPTGAVIGCDFDDDGTYNETTDGEWLAMGYISWPDAAAYLDWAGLRPMTEFEFEKACRGTLSPVPDEFAWGKASTATFPYHLINEGQATEAITNGSSVAGNAELAYTDSSYTNKNLRGGIFATQFSNRITSGAGYYGAMELSGNMYELCVTTWNVAGRSYKGKQGNGLLTTTGEADEDRWPGINGNILAEIANTAYSTEGVTGSAGIIVRGSNWQQNFTVSHRYSPSSGYTPVKTAGIGVRGVRDAN